MVRHVGGNMVTEKNLLMMARISTVPFALIAILIAAFYQSGHPQGATGYLLIVAFDVVLAGCVIPLFCAFYVKDPSPLAGLLSIWGGCLLRVILEFSLTKDGFLLLPWGKDEYLDYGPASSDLYPGWFDVPKADKWTPSTCEQKEYEDWTGVDSLAAPVFSFVVFFVIHFAEKSMGKPLIDHPLLKPYNKPSSSSDASPETEAVEVKPVA